MRYRKLGNTGLEVSVVGIGTYQYGGEWGKTFSRVQVRDILKNGQKHGINLIDTAECYGDHLSESLIGYSIKEDRSNWIIVSKFGHHFLPNFSREQIWDAIGVQKQLEDSLKALQTDYIDIYMFHSCTNEQLQNDKLWSFLLKAKQEGKIKHIGLSLKSQVQDNVSQTKYAIERGVEVIELLYNRLDRTPEKEVFVLCQKANVGVIARVPLASGFLSGKYNQGVIFPNDDVRSAQNGDLVDNRIAIVQEIKRKEVPENMNMAQWAIAWCLKHDAVSTCIPGFKSPEQLAQGVGAAEIDLVSALHPLSVH